MPLLERIRDLVQHQLSQLGAADDQPPRETLLIREGMYCGRRFERDGLAAIWFAEEGEIKFYGPQRDVRQVVSLRPDMASGTLRRAA